MGLEVIIWFWLLDIFTTLHVFYCVATNQKVEAKGSSYGFISNFKTRSALLDCSAKNNLPSWWINHIYVTWKLYNKLTKTSTSSPVFLKSSAFLSLSSRINLLRYDWSSISCWTRFSSWRFQRFFLAIRNCRRYISWNLYRLFEVILFKELTWTAMSSPKFCFCSLAKSLALCKCFIASSKLSLSKRALPATRLEISLK